MHSNVGNMRTRVTDRDCMACKAIFCWCCTVYHC